MQDDKIKDKKTFYMLLEMDVYGNYNEIACCLSLNEAMAWSNNEAKAWTNISIYRTYHQRFINENIAQTLPRMQLL
jgi:hypothetical protein